MNVKNTWILPALIGASLLFSCSSGSKEPAPSPATTEGTAATTSESGTARSTGSSDRSVIDITWGAEGQGGYSGRYGGSRERDRSLRMTNFRFDRKWYEQYVRSEDANGQPLKPVDQIQFPDRGSNVSNLNSITLSGAADPSTGAAVEPESSTASSQVPFIKPDGSKATLEDFRGRPLVVVFTRGFPGYICPMCTTYTAQFTVAYPQIKELGAELLLVFPGEASDAKDFVDACNEICGQTQNETLPFPVCLDADLKLVTKFNLKEDLSRPATIIFDAAGKMRFGFIGQNPHERPNVDRILKEVRAISETSK